MYVKRTEFDVITQSAFAEYDRDKRTKLLSPPRENAIKINVTVKEKVTVN
jgi:hypothetical protein